MKTPQEITERLVLNKFRLKVKGEGYNQLRITVVNNRNISHSQLLPFNHINKDFWNVVDYNISELIKKK